MAQLQQEVGAQCLLARGAQLHSQLVRLCEAADITCRHT
jgi:hypothetical protein